MVLRGLAQLRPQPLREIDGGLQVGRTLERGAQTAAKATTHLDLSAARHLPLVVALRNEDLARSAGCGYDGCLQIAPPPAI